MISSVTNQGKCRWMMIDGAFNSDRLIEFMQSLIKDTESKVFLILDNLRVHHNKPVKAWLGERSGRIEAFRNNRGRNLTLDKRQERSERAVK